MLRIRRRNECPHYSASGLSLAQRFILHNTSRITIPQVGDERREIRLQNRQDITFKSHKSGIISGSPFSAPPLGDSELLQLLVAQSLITSMVMIIIIIIVMVGTFSSSSSSSSSRTLEDGERSGASPRAPRLAARARRRPRRACTGVDHMVVCCVYAHMDNTGNTSRL